MDTSEPSPEQPLQAVPEQADHEIRTTSEAEANAPRGDILLDTESIQRGFIYPPPPTFYEQQERAAEITPLYTPPRPQKEQVPRFPPTMSAQSPTPYPPAAQQGFTPPYYPTSAYAPAPGYPPGVQPPFVTVPPKGKKSRRGLWIALAILAVIIVLSCGLCSWAAYPIVTQAYQQASSAVYGSQDLVSNYYGDIQNQQYSQAYSYLTSQGSDAHLTQAQFVQEAQQRDKQYGLVYSFSAGTPSVSYSNTSGQTIDSFSVDVTVARAKTKYTVHLFAQKVNGNWKIESFNQI